MKNLQYSLLAVLFTLSANSTFSQSATFYTHAYPSNFGCDNGDTLTGNQTPMWNVDLQNDPAAIQTIAIDIPSGGYGECCSYANNYSCLVLEILLSPDAGGVNFTLAGASGNTYIQYMNCASTPVIAGTPICINGVGPHYFMFCRTGTTDYSITVQSIPAPSGTGDLITTEGCNIQLGVDGLITSSITWSTINPGTPNQYNNYLSNLSGGQLGTSGVLYDQDLEDILITPQSGGPASITVEVCGEPFINSICPASIPDIWCALSTVTIYPDLFANPGPDVIICNGSITGADVSAFAVGGTAPYTYTWSGPGGFSQIHTHNNSVDNITAMVPGVYTVVISDATGCPTATTSITATEYFVDIIANAGSEVTICGIPTPVVNLTGTVSASNAGVWSGGNGTYSDNSNDLTLTYTPTASEISAGSVTLTLTPTNTGGCPYTTDQVTINLTQFTTVLSIVPTNISCFGLSDGSIDLTVSPGLPSYAVTAYSWSNGSTTQDISSLGLGTYNVIVTDANGCTGNFSASITQPSPLISSITSLSNVSCFGGNDGSVTVAGANATPTYTYSLNGGAFQTSGTFSGLSVGSYTVTVTDFNGCSVNQLVVITQPTPVSTNLTASVYSGGFNLSGCIPDGSINLAVNGGTPNYTYLWSNGSTSQDVSNLAAGNYSVTITDLNGCQTINNITLTEPSGLTQTISALVYPSGTNISCFGLSDGGINLTITGGTPGYTYLWDTGQTTEDLSNISAGTHSVTITDANGCQINSTIILTEPLALTGSITALVYPSGTNISCFGLSDGSIDLTIGGGNPGYSYSWSNGSAIEDPSGLVAGTYNVTVTDINGCSIPTTITLTEPPLLTSSLNPSVYAGGYNISGCVPDGTIDLTVLGGNPAYTYNWSNAQTSEDLSNLSAGTYNVTVTDVNGCQTISSITLTAANAMTQTISAYVYPSGTNISCFGLSDGSIDLTITGGSPGYTYLWDSGQTTQDLSGVPAGTYNVTVTDANGCQITSSITLTEPTALTESITAFVYPSGTNISCFSLSDGSIDLTIGGGSPGYAYSWSNGSTVEDPSGLVAGTYNVTVTDINGCSIPATITLTEPPLLTSSLNPSVYAGGYNISGCVPDGTIDLTVLGGNPAYTYNWSNTQTSEDLSNLSAGIYNVTVTDVNGCQTISSITLTAANAMTQTISAYVYPSGTNISCFGLSDGSIDLTITGGSPGYTYLWDSGQTTQDLSGVPAGTYNVTVSDANGCQITSSITLTEPTALTESITAFVYPSGTNISCFSLSDGSIDLSIGGGSPGYAYSWSNGSTVEDPSGLSAGTYNVTVTDLNGCQITSSITLTEPPLLTSSLSPSVYSGGYNISGCVPDGTIDLTVLGGNPAYTFDWSNTQTSEDLSNLSAGTYNVTVTDVNGCQTISSITLTAPNSMTQTITAFVYPSGTNISCFGLSDGSIDLAITGGSPGYTYLWDSGQTTQDLSGVPAGTYNVTVTDANGCQITSSITLTEPTALTESITAYVYPSGTNISCFSLSDGSIDFSIGGGSPGYAYSWSNGSAIEDPSGLAAGTYNVTVTDLNGCQITSSITLTEPPLLTSSLNPSVYSGGYNISGCVPDGTIDLTVLGGNPAYTFDWNNTATSEDLSNLSAGTYNVTVTDVNGCQTISSITLTAPNSMTQTITAFVYPSGTNISCFGLSDGSIDLAITGGSPGYTYLWDSGQTTQDLSGVPAGTYNVTVTDANGCQITSSITLTEPTALTESLTAFVYPSGTNISCFSLSDGSIDFSIGGGSSGYAYSWSNGSTVEDPSGLAAGTYNVTVTDLNGCQITSSITLIEPSVLVSSATISVYAGGYNLSGCSPNGWIDLSVNGGNSGYNYSWTNGDFTEDISNLSAGTYIATITDMNGCQTILDTVLTQPMSLTTTTSVTSNYNGQDISCVGASDGAIAVVVSGGTPSFFFEWINEFGVVVSNSQSQSGLPSGTYTINVIDQNGCSGTNSITLQDPPELFYNIVVATDYNGQNISCFGASDGGINFTVSGGTPSYTFEWHNSSGVYVGNTEDPANLPEGIYEVYVTDANGCFFDTTIVLTQPTELTGTTLITSDYNGQHVSCFQSTDGSAMVSVSGGTPNYSYSWINTGGTTLSSNTNLSGIGVGTYFVQIEDVNGCILNIDVELSQPTLLTSGISIISDYFGQAVSCNGAFDGIVEANVAGGTAGYAYEWNTNPVQNTQQATNLGVGTYTVTVTDTNGCVTTSHVELNANPLPGFNLPEVVYGCMGNSVELNSQAGPGSICTWTFSDGQTINDCGPVLVDFANQECYDMSLVLVNQFGCIDSISMEDFICIMPNPLAEFYAEEEELTNIENDTHFWNTSMGAESYIWDFGDGSPTDTSTNTQHVFVSDDDFNTITFPVTLWAITEYGCIDSAVRYIKLSPDLIFYVPNAFTPDGDKFNNVFKPVFSSGYSYENYQLLIFNRWGEVVFETQEIQEGWDGTYRGNKAQDGVYTWKLKVANSTSDRKEEHVGHVSLIKGVGGR